MSSTPLRAQQAILLKKNNPAPYAGILAPPGYIKDLEMKSKLASIYKKTIDENSNCLPELSSLEPTSGLTFWEGIVVGSMITGMIAVLISHH